MQRPTDTIDVVDPTGAIYTAIYGNLNIVVMDFEAPAVEPVATGTWTDVYYSELDDYTVFEDTSASFSTTVSVGDLIQPDTAQPSVWLTVSSVLSNSELAVSGDKTATSAPLVPYIVTDPIWSYSSGVSTYTNNSANFEDWMLGWLFTPDVNEPCYLQIVEVTSATSIKVKGDARGLSEPDDQWRIHAPPGVDNTTGGLHTDLTEAGSRYLYGSMRYMPPQAGFDVSGNVEGGQGGINVSGTFVDGYVDDPVIGDVFQDGDDNTVTPPRVTGGFPPHSKRSGYDRPTPYPRIFFGCSPKIYISSVDQPLEDYEAGIRAGVLLRSSWMAGRGVFARSKGKAVTHPGKWTLSRFRPPRGFEVGKAIAVAIILTWNCDCDWVSYDQRIMPGDQPDNYGTNGDKNDPSNNEIRISSTRPVANTGRCYRVFVDSVARWTSTKGAQASSHIYHQFKGTLTVEKGGKQYVDKHYWTVSLSDKDDGTVRDYDTDSSYKYWK